MMKRDREDNLDSAIVVWIAPISGLREAMPALEGLLDAQEHERAARFHFLEDRERFIVGRGLLRHGLLRFAPQLPATLELAYTELGRPVLPVADSALQFSISHAQDVVTLAFTNEAQVGIDLEYMKPAADLPGLAERILSADDFRVFQEIPEPDQPAAFYRAWTRKEAYLKALGEGIATGLPDVSVPFGPEKRASLADARAAGASKWRLHLLPLPEDYVGALACDEASRTPRWHRVERRSNAIITLALDEDNRP